MFGQSYALIDSLNENRYLFFGRTSVLRLYSFPKMLFLNEVIFGNEYKITNAKLTVIISCLVKASTFLSSYAKAMEDKKASADKSLWPQIPLRKRICYLVALGSINSPQASLHGAKATRSYCDPFPKSIILTEKTFGNGSKVAFFIFDRVTFRTSQQTHRLRLSKHHLRPFRTFPLLLLCAWPCLPAPHRRSCRPAA